MLPKQIKEIFYGRKEWWIRSGDGLSSSVVVRSITCDDMNQFIKEHNAFTEPKTVEDLLALLRMANCPNCDGSGVISRQVSQKQFVTRDMALDACDPNLEGQLYSDEKFEVEQCQWCFEKNAAITQVKKRRMNETTY